MRESDTAVQSRADAGSTVGKLVVAGIPRSGTTMMFRALAGLPPGTTTPALEMNGVLKTHSFEPETFAGAAWGIFLFGNPVLSVISTVQKRYNRNHFENCGAADLDPEEVDIFDADHLNYERMWDAWTARQSFPVVALRYESLHKSIRHVENLLGQDIPLPSFKRREASARDVSPEDLQRIRQTYAGLRRKVNRAPDFSLYLPDS